MKYIYESPDKGKTVYRTPIGVPNAKRELAGDDVSIEIEGQIISLFPAEIEDQIDDDEDPGYPGLPARGRQS